MDRELSKLLAAAARGAFPPADGAVTVLPAPSPRDAGVVSFTAHSVVFADVPPAWVRERIPPGDLAAPLNPPFLSALGARTGREIGCVDLLTVADALPGPPPVALAETAGADHPRIARALRHRDAVRAWTTGDGGTVVIGRGVAGRWELAVEVADPARGRGLGRALARAARHLIPDGDLLWAQVAPGNARSVRALLAAGYRPVGAEALLVPAG
ncbi:GCN5 family acetyltransferase [Streptomyces sp. NRRL F-4489]|uniref:GNAT family N-acetyltransferase n=1 Tax=Streptomyces sp. NRRL F-4489 TaxID=1609095 RepID=UPI000748A080|nr:GNAT family N-acetyltransferase [Streptomyces sp. NRRL F-4489]KUL49637.1 GCN5 family acetyltransferase [Streptomyces sp. NRRL F-4489]